MEDIFKDLLKEVFPEKNKTSKGKKRLERYWEGSRFVRDEEGREVAISLARNVHALRNSQLRSNRREGVKPVLRSKVDMIQAMIMDKAKGKFALRNEGHPGMKVVRQMMEASMTLCERNGMVLEPFQMECLRSLICSSGERLLGDELFLYVPDILGVCGLHQDSEMPTGRVSANALHKIFLSYSKQIVAVVAPRRNGKSKIGKLFVAANAIAEHGSRIVLSAHRVDAILLYKEEILKYLQQLMPLFHYKIFVSENEIRLRHQDDKQSFIYFVPGGKDVSISLFFWNYFVVSLCLSPLPPPFP